VARRGPNELLGGMDSRPRIHMRLADSAIVFRKGVLGIERKAPTVGEALTEAMEDVRKPAVIIWEGVGDAG